MNAYRIQNDIVAAGDEQQAIQAWAAHYGCLCATAGPVEQVNPEELTISIQDGDESFRDGLLAEVMPGDGPAEIVCFGECEGCE